MSFFRRSPPRAQTTPSSQRHVLKGRRARRGSALRHPSPRQHNALAFGLRWKHSEPSSPFVRYSRLFSHSQENTGTPQHTRGFPLKAESSNSKPPGPGTMCLPTATRVASTAATRSPRNCIPNWMRAEGAAPVARCAESHPRKRPCARAVPHDAPSPRRQSPRFCGSRLQRTSELASRRHAYCTAAALRA